MTAGTRAKNLEIAEDWLLDDRIRGVPVGTEALLASTVGALRWKPTDGRMQLPVLTLDEHVFLANRDLYLGYLGEKGVGIAPHAKTPMAPDLARALVDGGAWGATVADVRQASVLLRAGIDRLILANEVGGAGGAGRLAALVARWPSAEINVFADSVAVATALRDAWTAAPDLPPLRVLPELGAGRAGARDLDQLAAIIAVVTGSGGRLRLAGLGAYEGSAGRPTPEETLAAVDGLLALAVDGFAMVRQAAGPDADLLVTAGGSVWFDRVLAILAPAVAADGRARLVLRSGAIFFHDNGTYEKALADVCARGVAIAGGFRPALRIWAEVLSRPEPGLAVCGMGMRDVSFDRGLPVPLAIHRAGRRRPDGPLPTVSRLNDQHAFLDLPPDADVAVGDVVEFGISHPCTCLDRYRAVFGVDGTGTVQHAFRTEFG